MIVCPSAYDGTATFTRKLNEILRPLYAKYPGMFRHYMDDCIIMTEPGQRGLHEESVICSFDLLEQHQLFLNRLNANFPNRDGLPRIRR